MSVVILRRDDAALRLHDEGHGAPVVFQHGLGGDAAQVAGIFPADAPLRRLTLECRGHGQSTPGSRRPFTIGGFAGDVLAACDARGVTRCIAAGLSLGAAIALHLAVHHRARVTALILARPAWLFDPAPPTMRPYAEVAECLRRFGPTEGRSRFAGSATAAMLAREAPDNLASLLGFFERRDPATTADLLADIAADGPGVGRLQARALDLPTLVIGHAMDHVHPLATARELASAIPGARLVEITPKARDRERHAAEFRAAIADFARALSLAREQPT